MDIQTVSIVIAAVSVVIGVINSIQSSREAKRQRQTELFMQVYDRYNQVEYRRIFQELRLQQWNDYDDWEHKYGPPDNIDTWSRIESIGVYIEGIGVLVEEELIDLRLVNNLLHDQIITLWEKYEPIVKERRRRYSGSRRSGDSMEYLYNRVTQLEQTSAVSS
jgi:hypothetical protein